MPRADYVHGTQPQKNGWDMITNTRQQDAAPSINTGTYPTGVLDGTNTAACSTGGSLGTGMNTDRYTPAIESP